MNKALAIFALVIAVVTSSQAALLLYTDNQTVTTSGTTFTFSQFNPISGNLTAIDLIIQSSTLQGNLTYTRTSGSRSLSNLNAALGILSAPGLDDGYDTESFVYARTPSGNFTLNATNTSRLITVNGTTQSLIGGSPITLSLASSGFGSYLGTSTVTFTSDLLYGDIAGGSGSFTVNTLNLLSPTTLALQYTYTVPTPPSPVPEPSQVAASLLVIGGLGIYLLRRRQISTKSS